MISRYTIKDNKHCNELKKMGFSENRLCSPEMCENLYIHCKMYNMRFLKESYGTIVCKGFNKIFRKASNYKKKEELKEGLVRSILDHTNFLKVVHEDIYLLTSSPYNRLDVKKIMEVVRDYPHEIYAVNPQLLDYTGYIEHGYGLRNPLRYTNFAFTDTSREDMDWLNKTCLEELGIYDAFQPFVYSRDNLVVSEVTLFDGE